MAVFPARLGFVVAWAVTAAILVPPAQGQTTYRDDAGHWSLVIPRGWHQLPAEAVGRASERARALGMQRVPQYVAAFAREGVSDLVFPYLIVQVIPGAMWKANQAELEAAFTSGAAERGVDEVKQTLPKTLAGSAIGTPVFDRVKNRYVFRTVVRLPESGDVAGLSVGVVGNDGVVQLNFYDAGSSFQASQPEFDSLIAGFAFDPGYAYDPALSAQQNSRRFSGAWSRILGMTVVGAVAGAIVGVFRWLFRRGQSPTA